MQVYYKFWKCPFSLRPLYNNPILFNLTLDTIDEKLYNLMNKGYTEEEAKEMVKKSPFLLGHDDENVQMHIDDLISLGYTKEEFWAIVDKLYNPDFFEKKNGKWILKHPIESNTKELALSK